MLTTPSRRSRPILKNLFAVLVAAGLAGGGVAAGAASASPAGAAPASAAPAAAASEQPATRPAGSDGQCTVDDNLVPSCGLLWGAAAGGFTGKPRDEEMLAWEKKVGRPGTVFHTYHSGDQLFPTARELSMARDPKSPRVLMLNWKVADGTTWAKVAAGEKDARIDRLAAHIKKVYPDDPFYLVLHHEPENDVKPRAGSGMTAKDFAAMFRHTAERLEAQGVDNARFTVAYMNYEKWNNSPWWKDLYPGDDVVDWIGLDSYVNVQPGGFHNGDFGYLLDRTDKPAVFPGWYTWATTEHPGKPLILAEWGAYDNSRSKSPANKAKMFDTVAPQLDRFPAIKGLVYFDTKRDQAGRDIRIDDSKQALASFKRLAADPRFDVRVR